MLVRDRRAATAERAGLRAARRRRAARALSARPRFCSAACSIRPASLKTATGRHVGAQARGGEPALPQVGVAEQRLARERLGLRAEQAARGGRRADDDHRHRRVEQALRLEPGPRAVALRAPPRGSPRAAGRRGAARRRSRARASGCRSRQRPMRGSSQRCANDGSTVTRSAAPSPLAAAAAACTPSSSCASAACDAAQQRLAGRVEHDAPAAPLEQLEAELLLEPADLLAHGAVREVQLLGRGAQVLRVRRRRGRRAACSAAGAEGEPCW